MKIFLEYVSKELLTSIIDMILLCAIISTISIVLVKAIRTTIERAFIKSKIDAIITWIINVACSLIISLAVVLIFDGKSELYKTILYCFTIFVASWAFSILLYEIIIKAIFKLAELLLLKIEDLLIDMEAEKENSLNKLITIKSLNREIKTEVDVKKLISE